MRKRGLKSFFFHRHFSLFLYESIKKKKPMKRLVKIFQTGPYTTTE